MLNKLITFFKSFFSFRERYSNFEYGVIHWTGPGEYKTLFEGREITLRKAWKESGILLCHLEEAKSLFKGVEVKSCCVLDFERNHEKPVVTYFDPRNITGKNRIRKIHNDLPVDLYAGSDHKEASFLGGHIADATQIEDSGEASIQFIWGYHCTHVATYYTAKYNCGAYSEVVECECGASWSSAMNGCHQHGHQAEEKGDKALKFSTLIDAKAPDGEGSWRQGKSGLMIYD